jgi:YfiH family protein
MSVAQRRKHAFRQTSRGHRPGSRDWLKVRSGELEILQAEALAKLPWLVHGFSTRRGGTSRLEGSRDSRRVLNLGFTHWDTRENVLANRAKLLSALSAEGMKLATLRQFHSDVIHVLDAPPEHSPRGDAAITRARGLLLAVQTADCVPILLVDPKRRAVAAVHAGWRGTLGRIVAKTVGRMCMAFGTHPSSLVAVLGPAIGVCCYEVGPEVAQAYASQFAEARKWLGGPFDRLASGEEPNPLKWLSTAPPGHDPPLPRVRLDLLAANRWQLLDAGIKGSNILSSELCTSCRTDLFFSYRREHARTGRLMVVIGLRAGIERAH